MTTATRSVAVIATRLPSIDRRTLSQAWYSALHLTQSSTRAATSQRPVATAPGVPPKPRPGAPSNVASSRTAVLSRPAHEHRLGPAAGAASERRSVGTDLARRIERALVRHGELRPARPVAMAINAGDGRVQLLVRTDGGTTRIVALCAPHLRERVDRALASARFALAAAGTPVAVMP